MKIAIPCTICSLGQQEKVKPTVLRPIGDTSFYDITCEQGHTLRVRLLNNRFEVLFESGIQALIAGFNREALTSFVVALERFYEFSIILLLMDSMREKDSHVITRNKIQSFSKFWRGPLKFSERQLGAFCSLYINEFCEFPILFDNAELRNKVVHAGYIPSYAESLEFGEQVNKSIQGFSKRYSERDECREGAFKRVQMVSGIGVVLDEIRLKQPSPGNYGPSSKAKLFIDVTSHHYLTGSQSIADYISEIA